MQASCNRSTVVDKVSTCIGPCHQQNFGHDSKGYTKLNIVCVHTNHVC